MKNSFIYSQVERVFLKALNYPDYARPEYFIKEQEKSGWSKGVFLRTLLDTHEHYSLRLQVYTGQQERLFEKENKNLSEDFGLNVEKETEGQVKGKLTKAMLEDLRYSILNSYKLDSEKPTFDSYQIIAFCERILLFIKAQFGEQVEETSSAKFIADRLRKEGQLIPGEPNFIIYTYNIISDAPVADFHRFRNEIRKLLLNSANPLELKTILKPLYTIGVEIVNLWNSKLQPIEVAFSEEDRNKYVRDRRLITFDPEDMKIWHRNIYSPNDFYREPSTHFMNQDFASFAAKVANIISSEILKNSKNKIEFKTEGKVYDNFDELFIKPSHVAPAFELLKEAGLIGDDYSYIGKLKSAFCIWTNELKSARIIDYASDITITILLNRKFKGLNMDSSNFRTNLTKASREYKSKFKKSLTVLSQGSQP